MRPLMALVFLLASCGEGTPTGVLPKEKMQAVYWDIIVADVKTQEYIAKDSLKNDSVENARIQQQIFVNHNTTREEFYRSLDYYRALPNQWNVMLDTMMSRGTRERYIPTSVPKSGPQSEPVRVRPVKDSIPVDSLKKQNE